MSIGLHSSCISSAASAYSSLPAALPARYLMRCLKLPQDRPRPTTLDRRPASRCTQAGVCYLLALLLPAHAGLGVNRHIISQVTSLAPGPQIGRIVIRRIMIEMGDGKDDTATRNRVRFLVNGPAIRILRTTLASMSGAVENSRANLSTPIEWIQRLHLAPYGHLLSSSASPDTLMFS